MKVQESLGTTFKVDGHELTTSVSIGITVYPDDGKDFDVLLKKADTALYKAKEGGRNAYQFYTEQMNSEAIEYLKIRNGLRQALINEEFLLHYQPQINLADGKVVGVEALIRWRHPELGILQPARFISIAEDSGLIVPIGDWALKRACLQAVEWREAGLPPIVMAVNLSAVQFRRGDIEKSVLQPQASSGDGDSGGGDGGGSDTSTTPETPAATPPSAEEITAAAFDASAGGDDKRAEQRISAARSEEQTLATALEAAKLKLPTLR